MNDIGPPDRRQPMGDDQYRQPFVEFLCVGVGAAVGFAVAQHAWRFQGLLAYIGLVTVVAGYIAYSLLVTLPRVPR